MRSKKAKNEGALAPFKALTSSENLGPVAVGGGALVAAVVLPELIARSASKPGIARGWGGAGASAAVGALTAAALAAAGKQKMALAALLGAGAVVLAKSAMQVAPPDTVRSVVAQFAPARKPTEAEAAAAVAAAQRQRPQLPAPTTTAPRPGRRSLPPVGRRSLSGFPSTSTTTTTTTRTARPSINFATETV